MRSIGYMTITRWVGHKDGEVLIGKVYRHLNYEQKETDKTFKVYLTISHRLNHISHIINLLKFSFKFNLNEKIQ